MSSLKIFPSKLMIDAFDFSYENNLVFGTVATFDNELNIQMIISQKEGKGNCQKCITDLINYAQSQNLVLVSSSPLSPVWEHIANKFKLKIYV